MTMTPRLHAIAFLLAFTAGSVDTIGFVGLFGLFTAHVTGNFVLIGASLYGAYSGIVAKLLALPVFIVSVSLASSYARRASRAGGNGAGVLLITQALFLSAFLTLALLLGPFKSGGQPAAILVGLVAVAAMGIQNAASRTAFTSLSPTTVMTGNVTQLVMDATEWLEGRGSPETKVRMAKMAPPVLAFGGGAILAGLAFGVFGFWVILAPIAAILTVLVIQP